MVNVSILLSFIKYFLTLISLPQRDRWIYLEIFISRYPKK